MCRIAMHGAPRNTHLTNFPLSGLQAREDTPGGLGHRRSADGAGARRAVSQGRGFVGRAVAEVVAAPPPAG